MERRGCGWLRTAAGGLRSGTWAAWWVRGGGRRILLLLSAYFTADGWSFGFAEGRMLELHYSGELLVLSTRIFTERDSFVARSTQGGQRLID